MIPVRENDFVPLGPQIDEMRYRVDEQTGEMLSPDAQFKEAVYRVLLEFQGSDDALDEQIDAIYNWLHWYFSDVLRRLEIAHRNQDVEEDELVGG